MTSSSMTGGSVGSRLAIRLVMPSARPKFEIRTVAPCSCATFAVAKPIEESMRDAGDEDALALEDAHASCLSGVGGRSVAHAEAAVDRDDGAGDVAGVVRGEPAAPPPRPPRWWRSGRAGSGAWYSLLLLLGQHGGHVGVDEARAPRRSR